MKSVDEIAAMVQNVRYADDRRIGFDVDGVTYFIRDPLDVMLVGWPGASKWIAKHYGYLIG